METEVPTFLFMLAISIFALSYIIIISEKVHRIVIAIAGAALMVLLGVITQEEAINGIDFNTIGLLIGMMMIVGISKDSGMFEFVAIWSSKITKGNPVKVFIALGSIVAIFSALLDNVTTVLLMVPVMFIVANNLRINAKPFLISAIILSNIGGAATLIGDPPNILIGSAANLSFNDFLINLAPISLVITFVTIGMLLFWYRKELVTTPEARESVMRFNPQEVIREKPLLIKSLITLAIVMVGFMTHEITGLEGATIALAGAALLLLLTLNEPEAHLRDIEWTTIFFFSGLFILVVGLEAVGIIRIMAEGLLNLTGGDLTKTAFTILWGSALLSAIIDNVPYVATMIPVLHDYTVLSGVSAAPLWWALALGADIGGNATIIGASANVVVAGMSEREGHKISFLEYLKVAISMTLVAMIIASVYLYVRYLM